MTTSPSKNYWVVEMHCGSSSFYCPECYQLTEKKVYIRVPVYLLPENTQCPGCSIEVSKWKEEIKV